MKNEFHYEMRTVSQRNYLTHVESDSCSYSFTGILVTYKCLLEAPLALCSLHSFSQPVAKVPDGTGGSPPIMPKGLVRETRSPHTIYTV